MVHKLDIRNLAMEFSKKTILDGLSFSVEDGEFFSILGPSGCGKTTLLRILIGLLAPTGGTIHKDGCDITTAPASARGMGIVFQNYALFANMSVLGNVEYALRFQKDKQAQRRDIAMRLLEKVCLSEHANQKPHKLSGGQQQRVAIARTLALNPDIILFDEPMSALDVATRLTLRDELKRIQHEFGTTMIYITHDQEEAFAMSDHIMVMDHGRIAQLDTPAKLISHPANAYIEEFVIQNLQVKMESLSRYMRS